MTLPGSPIDIRHAVQIELPYLRALLGRLVSGGRVAAEPEDLVQEVVVRALRYEESFDGEQSLRGWLGRIGFRVYLDQRERLARAPVPLDGDGLAGERGDESERGAEAREEIERLLARLSDLERHIVLRFHRHGDSLADLAAGLSLPMGTVKSHLYRARRKLGRVT